MGFTRGLANPCCFVHHGRSLSLVVHGDDFTCVGAAKDLEWYESEMQKAFQIKIRGRMGEAKGKDNEMWILNRIVRLDEDGLLFEADPRHAELLIKSMGLEDAGHVVTPGDKNLSLEEDAEPDDDDDNNSTIPPIPDSEFIGNFLKVKCIDFNDNPDVYDVIPYAEHYNVHPRDFVFGKEGKQRCFLVMQILSPARNIVS